MKTSTFAMATMLLTCGALNSCASAPLRAQAEPQSQSQVQAQASRLAANQCEAMIGQSVGDLAITSATYNETAREIIGTMGQADITLPPHCLVSGMINRREGAAGKTYGIGFELALPAQWNGRFLLMGGGGLNGAIRPPVGPVASGESHALARGFAVLSHDSGHQGVVFDASFQADQRASLDFAETSVRTVTLTGRDLVAAYYGEAAHHSYMTGCSTGGREGMLASQRYPELFDGIVVGAPAMRPGFSNLTIENAQVMLNRTLPANETDPAGFSQAERDLISGEVLRQCDGQDGLADGMVMNVKACQAFDVTALQCSAGESENCLSSAKVEALQLGFQAPKDAAGRPIYVDFPWDTGITFQGAGLPGFLPSGQPSPFGPASTAREIDIDERINAIRMDAAGRLTDTAYWTNLSTFMDRGSKMMFFHGVSDPWFSAYDTWDYFQRAGEANGERWDDSARFYMVPGMMHCSGGNAFEQFDLLGPLVDWVEKEEAPSTITARRSVGKAGEMAMCPHPQYPHYEGGDKDKAESFSCRMPAD